MNLHVFISWSGPLSHEIAKIMRSWLSMNVLGIKFFLSSKDISKGTRWFDEISKKLSESDYGIICLTPDNLDSKWLHFEAGALAKHLGARVTPIVFGVSPSSVSGPLALLQMSNPTEEEMRQLVLELAARREVDVEPVKELFDRLWPECEAKLDAVITAIAPIELSRAIALTSIREPAQSKANRLRHPKLGLPKEHFAHLSDERFREVFTKFCIDEMGVITLDRIAQVDWKVGLLSLVEAGTNRHHAPLIIDSLRSKKLLKKLSKHVYELDVPDEEMENLRKVVEIYNLPGGSEALKELENEIVLHRIRNDME